MQLNPRRVKADERGGVGEQIVFVCVCVCMCVSVWVRARTSVSAGGQARVVAKRVRQLAE